MPTKNTKATGPRPRRAGRLTPSLSRVDAAPVPLPKEERKQSRSEEPNAHAASSLIPSRAEEAPIAPSLFPEVSDRNDAGIGERGVWGGAASAEVKTLAEKPNSGDTPIEMACGLNGTVRAGETNERDGGKTLAEEAREIVEGNERGGEGEIAAATGGKRKRVVRRVVKVVKLIKRVPRKAQKEATECSDKELEKREVFGNVANAEKSVMPMQLEEQTDSSVSLPQSTVEPDALLTVDLETKNLHKTEVLEGEKSMVSAPTVAVIPNVPFSCLMEAESSSKTEVREGEGKEGSCIDDSNGVDMENPAPAAEIVVEAVNLDLIKDGNDKPAGDNVLPDGEGGNGEVDRSQDDYEKVKRNGLNGGLIWSGEMEALERQKRRKTEIFVGGLDKGTTEEDIRKIFEEVGEVVEVRLLKNSNTGKNKGYAFVRYALATDAKKALEKYPNVEISGKLCGTQPAEGNDTVFLGNINKKWKTEDVINLLQEIGVEKIDKVTVITDPNNPERNRGFAFLELETYKDAQIAYKKLQKQDETGKLQGIKVAWAEPLNEPDEEEMLKVKSVYAEFIPSSWDEQRVKDFFLKFGEIENVVLARNLRSSKRKDFAFVNFKSRESALLCIQSLNNEPKDDGSKVNLKVSMAKPLSKKTSAKKVPKLISKDAKKEKPKATPRGKTNESGKIETSSSTNYLDRLGASTSSRTAEALQFLRGQSSWRLSQTRLSSVTTNVESPHPLTGNKRPFPVLEGESLYSDPRGYGHARLESAFPAGSHRFHELSRGTQMLSLPYYQQQSTAYTRGYGYADYRTSFQRDEDQYHGASARHYRFM